MNTPNPSTVGRGMRLAEVGSASKKEFSEDGYKLFCSDALECYEGWDPPTVIVSDGAYGILGFQGDTASHADIGAWYEPHIIEWSKYALPCTTLWFWNSEIGWASIHPILEKNGWKYVNANIWNKGKAHIAGNINTSKVRRFPVVTELCVQYVFAPKIDELDLQHWLIREWKRTRLPFKKANEACGVKDVAVRKYLTKDHLWYFPPADMFEKMSIYANAYGEDLEKPFFAPDGLNPLSAKEWATMRAKFNCPVGFTNVWDRPPLKGHERIKIPEGTKAAHLNQKPLDLLEMIIKASSDEGDMVWEPFGGLFSASIAATQLKRKACGSEIMPAYFDLGIKRIKERYLIG